MVKPSKSQYKGNSRTGRTPRGQREEYEHELPDHSGAPSISWDASRGKPAKESTEKKKRT